MTSSNPLTEQQEKHALVLSGGGARAAYQIGALRHIAKTIPEYRPQILTGVSAGAINAVYLASSQKSWQESVAGLAELWLSLETNRVYHTDIGNILKRAMVWTLRIISAGRLGRADVHGMVDNSPLRAFLGAHLPLDGQRISGIPENIEAGLLDSLAIITTSYGSGRSQAWIESKNQDAWTGSQLRARLSELTLDHVMASSALPIFFPAVRLNKAWHGDGGIRLTAPLSPALHLGATRILAVSPRSTPVNVLPEDLRTAYPSPAQIVSTMMNAVFLDLLDYDAIQMNRINRLVEKIPEDERGSFRQVDVMVLRPREDLGVLAREHEIELPRSFRFFERGLDNRTEPSSDALSMVMFEPEYLSLLIRLGEEDAAARHDEIESFIRGGACALPPV
ncbi:MAG: patatin [Pseudomonadales bacterium]|nr:patatin [Pseudomonadales bacterium]